MAYPVVLKQLIVSNLSSRLAAPFRPAAVTDVAFDRFSTTFRRAYGIKRLSLIPKTRTPHSSKTEDAEQICLSVHMPGLEKEEVKATVKNEEYYMMHVQGKVMYNFESKHYIKKITLPNDINMNGITAEMNDGLLRVTLPKLKQEEILPDKIVVKIN
ncbi:hypothetical protein CTI12_AA182840 [Artemisia annua]|uniref:SHSP domain-containing protein n=1 Tax=Artemisia annua TaxID=35608 RepID=A0A2U1P8G1_ARTAN|nr:hypothetical protein CTI12_AA182840 [Artemisia annua]